MNKDQENQPRTISEVIRGNFEYYMKRAGKTIGTIAAEKGVTRQTIYSYFREGGTIATLEKMSALVGCNPWQLLAPDEYRDDNNPENIRTCPHCGKPIIISLRKPEI